MLRLKRWLGLEPPQSPPAAPAPAPERAAKRPKPSARCAGCTMRRLHAPDDGADLPSRMHRPGVYKVISAGIVRMSTPQRVCWSCSQILNETSGAVPIERKGEAFWCCPVITCIPPCDRESVLDYLLKLQTSVLHTSVPTQERDCYTCSQILNETSGAVPIDLGYWCCPRQTCIPPCQRVRVLNYLLKK